MARDGEQCAAPHGMTKLSVISVLFLLIRNLKPEAFAAVSHPNFQKQAMENWMPSRRREPSEKILHCARHLSLPSTVARDHSLSKCSILPPPLPFPSPPTRESERERARAAKSLNRNPLTNPSLALNQSCRDGGRFRSLAASIHSHRHAIAVDARTAMVASGSLEGTIMAWSRSADAKRDAAAKASESKDKDTMQGSSM